MKSVSAEMFRKVRKALMKYISVTGTNSREIPTRLCPMFLAVASETMSEYGYENGASIVIRNRNPHLMIDEEADVWEDSNTLCIGGVYGIKNESLKKATMAFLTAYIRNNPFISYNDTVWSGLTEAIHQDYPEGYESDNDEDNDALRSYQEDMMDNIRNEKALNLFFQEIKAADIPTREALVGMLDAVQPESAYEKELLETLKSGVPYAYEKRWVDDEFESSGYGYANVCVSPWDYFCVNYASNDPFVIGIEMTNSVYDGDIHFEAPRIQKLLLDDGTFEDIYDRKGFSAFCQKLTNNLTNF